MISLNSSDQFNITGRGLVYLIETGLNDLPVHRKDIVSLLMHQRVLVNGKPYEVRGIEFRGIPDWTEHSHIGLLVRETQGELAPM